MEYVIYVIDTETSGFDSYTQDVIELSLYRMSDEVQKTWYLKPLNFQTIDAGALRINGHKLEDITHQTAYGRQTYQEASKVIVEIENFISEDNVNSEMKVLVGQNVAFDLQMIKQLWTKLNSSDTFPFGRRVLDTMSLEFAMDLAKGSMAEGYSLSNLTKKYGLKNERKHSAESDAAVTVEVFKRQIEALKKALNK